MRFMMLLLVFASFNVHADGFFRPAFSYTIDNSESNGFATKENRRMIDLGGGYVGEKGLVVMGQYSTEKKQKQTEPSPATNEDRTSLGVGAGWMSRKEVGPYITGIYYLQSEDQVSGTTYKGKGYEVDLGLRVSIQKFFVGFQLTYRSFKYTEISSGSSTSSLTQPRKQTNLDPTVAVIFEF
jgi:hypothetical protein